MCWFADNVAIHCCYYCRFRRYSFEAKPSFLVSHERLLEGMEYGGTPLSRAVINVNVAFQELRGEPVTTNFGPPRGGGPK